MFYVRMNLRGLIGSILIISLLSCILLSNEKPQDYQIEFSGIELPTEFNSASNPLNLTSRLTIYNYIQENPAAHLRKISSDLSISIGSVQYHLDRLIEGELIESERDSKYRRFFLAKKFSEFEKRLLSLMNRPTTAMIIELLSKKREIQHQVLASSLGITSQAISWQVKLLKDQGIITCNEKLGETFYSMASSAKAVKIGLENLSSTYLEG